MYPDNLVSGGVKFSRISQVLHWIVAIDAFDYCDPAPLAKLLRGDEEIPPELRPALADIVSGARKPNKKAAVKLKVPAAERLMIAAHISVVLGIIDEAKHGHSYEHDSSEHGSSNDLSDLRKSVEIRADRLGVEVIDEVRRTDAFREKAYALATKHFGISRETVENMLRDLRKKFREFPDI